jgi:hypothetical protein
MKQIILLIAVSATTVKPSKKKRVLLLLASRIGQLLQLRTKQQLLDIRSAVHSLNRIFCANYHIRKK